MTHRSNGFDLSDADDLRTMPILKRSRIDITCQSDGLDLPNVTSLETTLVLKRLRIDITRRSISFDLSEVKNKNDKSIMRFRPSRCCKYWDNVSSQKVGVDMTCRSNDLDLPDVASLGTTPVFRKLRIDTTRRSEGLDLPDAANLGTMVLRRLGSYD